MGAFSVLVGMSAVERDSLEIDTSQFVLNPRIVIPINNLGNIDSNFHRSNLAGKTACVLALSYADILTGDGLSL